MSQMVQLTIPDEIIHQANEVAARTRRQFEDVLVEWLGHAVEELSPEALSDEQVIALANLQLEAGQQQELSELLARSRENRLDVAGHARLDELMQIYRRGMVRKAQAMKVAVERGLKPSLG